MDWFLCIFFVFFWFNSLQHARVSQARAVVVVEVVAVAVVEVVVAVVVVGRLSIRCQIE